MSALPAEPPDGHHADPLDPEQILSELPEDEREFFLSQYREAAEAAQDPAGYKQLHRLLRLWRYHAEAVKSPGYAEALEAVRRPASESGGMLLEDVIRLRERGELEEHLQQRFGA